MRLIPIALRLMESVVNAIRATDGQSGVLQIFPNPLPLREIKERPILLALTRAKTPSTGA